jgi:Peptidase family M28/Fibronectin type III domain/FlgD Ig-like domain
MEVSMCSPRPHLEPRGGDPGRRPHFTSTLAAAALVLFLLPLGPTPGRAAPGSFSSGLPLNPAVSALVDSVSETRLRLSVERLAGFFTRHTVSDTASATTGIGAARRWTRDQYAAYGAANGGNLTSGYFDFLSVICNTPGAYRNVLAQQNGSRYPNRFFIVSGHLDGRTVDVCDATSFAPAANDDGSGTAVSLEMSYLIGKLNIESSMIFMAVVGEDQGLFGSQAYADFAAQNGMDIAGMGTDDVCGNIRNELNQTDSTRVRHFSGGLATSNSRQLARYFKLKGEAYQPGFTVDLIPAIDRPGRSGDHVPFHNKGYAAVRFTEAIENLSQQHTDQDLPQFINYPYLTKLARVNLAGFASLLLAPKPPTGMQVRDVGNGTDVRVTWNPNSENDLAGYRVAFRFDTGDSLYYQNIFDAGLATTYTITGLTTGTLIQVSVSAYDNTWNESVFCQEGAVTPRLVPLPPANFQTTSFTSRVDLDWSPNLELDIQSYGVYRSSSPNSGFQLMQFVPVPTTHFEDPTVPPATTLYYRLTARDMQGFESPPTVTRKGRLVDHALPALIVDATPDGAGGPTPPDARVDAFYAAMMAGIPVSGEFDRADSVAVGNFLSDADLGAHRLVLYHTDSRNAVVREDTTVLRKYLQQGGKLILSGSNLAFTFGGSQNLINSPWLPGQFMHDILKANELRTENSLDLIGVDPQIAGYPTMNVDPLKAFLGRLANQDAYIGPLVGGPATEVVYHYRSILGPAGQNHGKPNVIRVLTGGTKMVAFHVPLYFLDSLAVRTTISQALTDLGESTLGILAAEAPPPAPSLGLAHPNPFRPATTIPFTIGVRGEVLLRIFDVQGRVVRTLVDATLAPGPHSAVWDGLQPDGRPVGSGVYFVDLTAAEQTLRRKLVLLR